MSKKTFYTDLILENGELVRIECPNKFIDEFFETIEHSIKLKCWWSPHQWDGCTATYMGNDLERVNMGKVVGIL